jgi:hypothetical protein
MTPQSLVGLLLLFLGLPPLTVVCHALFPALIARTRHNLAHRPWRSLGVGLINASFFGLLAAAFFAGDEGARLIGVVIASAWLSLVMVGLTAIAGLIGERVRPADTSCLRRLVAGILLLEFAMLTPVVGWFVAPILAGLSGGGAAIMALVWRRGPAPAGPLADPVSPPTGGQHESG